MSSCDAQGDYYNDDDSKLDLIGHINKYSLKFNYAFKTTPTEFTFKVDVMTKASKF